MSLLADALQPVILPGLFGVGGRLPAEALSDLVLSPRAAFLIGFDTTRKRIEMEFGSQEPLAIAFAADSSNLSVSCLQSLAVIWPQEEERVALPWSLIRLYYSAFYAAHVFVRLLGTACCWLERRHITHLATLAGASGTAVPWPLEQGTYVCAVDGTRLDWLKSAQTGAHEALWASLDVVIANASARVLSGSMAKLDAQQVYAQLESFRSMSKRNGGLNWISRTRNELQYKLAHGVWHPAGVSRRDRERLKRLAGQWTYDPMQIDLDAAAAYGELGELASASAFLLAATRVLLLRLEERSSVPRHFVRYGARAFANAVQMPL